MAAIPEYDPVYLHTRREARMILILFALAMTWSVGSYYLIGYVKPLPEPQPFALEQDPRFTPTPVATTLGIPTWVVVGILIPWLVIDCVAFWFCYYYMADDDLGPSPDDDPPPETST